MLKIKKGDTVQVIKGRDRGKKGKVLEIRCERNVAVVQNINMLKKHKRRARQDEQGGIVQIEGPIAISNLMVICKNCNKPARVGFGMEGETKVRQCKACKGTL